MLKIDKYALNSVSFEFTFTTTDGDKIDLKLSDSIEAYSSFKKSRSYLSQEFTLKHQFGYEFKYEGNGLSKKDIEEIKEAFKKIKPMLKQFLKEKNENDKVMANIANHLKSFLPPLKNQNHLNALKQEGVDSFDEVLKSIRANLDDVKIAKKLFDKLFSNKLEVYA